MEEGFFFKVIANKFLLFWNGYWYMLTMVAVGRNNWKVRLFMSLGKSLMGSRSAKETIRMNPTVAENL